VPIDRDRERAKRRHVRRQAALQARAHRARRNQQVVGAALAVILVVGGVFLLSQQLDTSPAGGSAAVGATTAPSTAPSTPSSASPNSSSGASSPTPTKSAKQYADAPPRTLAQGKTWDATVRTNRGTLSLELYGDKAPQTVSSFIFLSRDKYYDGTACHRITLSAPLQVLQCGDPTGSGTGGPGYTYGIENAPKDGQYPAGTLAMARTQDPDSNGSQFFITYAASTLPTQGGGYSVFGKVTKGLDVLTSIAKEGTASGESDGAPKNPVTITSITVEPR
jgi:peptidyl-prolyl cis-trans isomerase B (cyclophilin B)